MAKLSTLAKTIRSKNAGVDLITFDVIFTDKQTYERVKRAQVITRESVCALYRIPAARIADFVVSRSLWDFVNIILMLAFDSTKGSSPAEMTGKRPGA